MDKKKLTDKQEMFCMEYMVDLNGKQAAIRARYSEQTAENQASRLLSNVKVQERIAELKKERSEKVEITAERVLEEIAIQAFSDITDYWKESDYGKIHILTLQKFKDMPKGASKAIASMEQIQEKDGTIKVKLRLWDKVRSQELLCKNLGITPELLKHEAGPSILRELAMLRIAEGKKKKEEGKD